MKQRFNKIAAALLVLALCVGLVVTGAVSVSAAEAMGTCGKDLTWTLENGVLTISGTGDMDSYNDLFVPPWSQYSASIQRVVVSEGVTSVGQKAFQGAVNLVAVTLPASVTVLEAYAFADCVRLKQITIPGVETIGWGCFSGCSVLNNVSLPECLRSIGGEAFYQCSKLSGITIPRSVEQLGIMAFSYCKNLVYVKIQARLAVLPNWTFYGCVMLWEVYLPSSIEVVEPNAFGECPNLYYVDYGGTEEVRDEIYDQLSQPTTMLPDADAPTDVVYKEKENASITTTVNTPGQNSDSTIGSGADTVMDATITTPEGWDDVVEGVTETLRPGSSMDVVVQVQGDLTMSEGALNDLSGEKVTVTIQTSQNVDWEIVMQDQTEGSLSAAQDFNVNIGKNTPGVFSTVLGNASSYTVNLGYTSLYTTVRFPLGREVARQVATLYRVNGEELEKLASVLVDDDGMAAYSLAGTKSGAYIIALNVAGISMDEVIIPKSLSKEYGLQYNDGAMMDIYGTKYVVTGVTSELGFGIGTMTLIIVGVLVGSAVVIGVIMTMWNKQRKNNFAAMYGDAPAPIHVAKPSEEKQVAPKYEKFASLVKKLQLPKKKIVEEKTIQDSTEQESSFSALEEKMRRRKKTAAGRKQSDSQSKSE